MIFDKICSSPYIGVNSLEQNLGDAVTSPKCPSSRVLRTRMDQMYEDKLEGKIDDEFWMRKMKEWREQGRRFQSELSRFKAEVTDNIVLTAKYSGTG